MRANRLRAERPARPSRGASNKRWIASCGTRTSLPLLIGSKGVARVLSELLGVRQTAPVGNGEWLSFDLAPLYASARARAPRAAALAACPAEACS